MTDDRRKPPPPPTPPQTEGGEKDASKDGGSVQVPDTGMAGEGGGDPKRPGGMGGEG